LSARALPQTPLGELTALPRLPSCIQGACCLREGRGEDEREWERREGKERMGTERRGEGGVCPLPWEE